MRTVFVVVDQPLVGDSLDLVQIGEQMCVEHFGSVRSVETLDEGILIRLARLDVAHCDAPGGGPFSEGLGDHLGTIVQPNRVWHSVAVS